MLNNELNPEGFAAGAQVIRKCLRCQADLKSTWCGRCLSDFVMRSKYVTGKAAADELIEWKKAEIPQSLMVRRACELAKRSVRPLELMDTVKLKGLLAELKVGRRSLPR